MRLQCKRGLAPAGASPLLPDCSTGEGKWYGLSSGLAVQASVLDRLGDVVLQDILYAFEIGYRPCNLEDSRVAPGTETEAVGDYFQHAVSGRIRLAELADHPGGHLRVAPDARSLEALLLDFPRPRHAQGYLGRTLGLAPVSEIAVLDGGHLYVDVDPVQERPGNPGTVTVDHERRARALVYRVGKVAAWAGVHSGDQHDAGGIGNRGERAGDGDAAVLHWLTQHLENVLLELGEFIQKEHPVMRERHLARLRGVAAADQPHVGDGVVRGAEGTGGDERVVPLQKPHHAVDLGRLDRLLEEHGREDGGDAPGQHGLAGTGRADHQDVVISKTNFQQNYWW